VPRSEAVFHFVLPWQEHWHDSLPQLEKKRLEYSAIPAPRTIAATPPLYLASMAAGGAGLGLGCYRSRRLRRGLGAAAAVCLGCTGVAALVFKNQVDYYVRSQRQVMGQERERQRAATVPSVRDGR
jgi:hypothetical protein